MIAIYTDSRNTTVLPTGLEKGNFYFLVDLFAQHLLAELTVHQSSNDYAVSKLATKILAKNFISNPLLYVRPKAIAGKLLVCALEGNLHWMHNP